MGLDRRPVLGVALALSLLAGACGGDASPPDSFEGADDSELAESADPTTSTSADAPTTLETTTSTTDASADASEPSADPDGPAPSPDDEIFDEYIANRVQAFYEIRDEAFAEPSSTPETDYPGLADYADEPQLSVMYDAIKELAEQGRAHREPESPAVGETTDEEHRTSGVQTSEPGVVTVFDCEVNDEDIYEVATDEVKIAGVLTVLRVVTLKEFDGVWKLTETEVTQKIEGVAGCYLASESDFPY